jgi:hypothetical protein
MTTLRFGRDKRGADLVLKVRREPTGPGSLRPSSLSLQPDRHVPGDKRGYQHLVTKSHREPEPSAMQSQLSRPYSHSHTFRAERRMDPGHQRSARPLGLGGPVSGLSHPCCVSGR